MKNYQNIITFGREIGKKEEETGDKERERRKFRDMYSDSKKAGSCQRELDLSV